MGHRGHRHQRLPAAGGFPAGAAGDGGIAVHDRRGGDRPGGAGDGLSGGTGGPAPGTAAGDGGAAAEYRAACLNLGRRGRVLRPDGERSALAVSLTPDYGLAVRYDDGTEEVLRSGEVSVRGLYGYTDKE